MITHKRCPSCGVVKPVSDFGCNQSLADGRSFYCLECSRARNRAWYREKRRALGEEIRDHSWVPAGSRWCPSCRRAVAHDDYMRSSRTASGFGSRCKACHKAAKSEYYFQRKHRLSKSQVADLKAAQGGRCAICGDPAQHLDHDHGTGATRQMLCQRCNQGLGLFRDDPALLHAAALYVDAHLQRQLLARLRETFVVGPATGSPSAEPPVGS
jgi:hypothetical protein